MTLPSFQTPTALASFLASNTAFKPLRRQQPSSQDKRWDKAMDSFKDGLKQLINSLNQGCRLNPRLLRQLSDRIDTHSKKCVDRRGIYQKALNLLTGRCPDTRTELKQLSDKIHELNKTVPSLQAPLKEQPLIIHSPKEILANLFLYGMFALLPSIHAAPPNNFRFQQSASSKASDVQQFYAPSSNNNTLRSTQGSYGPQVLSQTNQLSQPTFDRNQTHPVNTNHTHSSSNRTAVTRTVHAHYEGEDIYRNATQANEIATPYSLPLQKTSNSTSQPGLKNSSENGRDRAPRCLFREACKRKFVLGDAYSNNADPMRDRYAVLIDKSHEEYARKWNATHVVNTDSSLLEGQCIDPRKALSSESIRENCSPYWLKIPVLKQWLEGPRDPTVDEEWRILLDDDMAITDMTLNPNEIIDRLRGNTDSSIILVKDPNNWPVWFLPQPTDPKIAINGGLWFVRKDRDALNFINQVWETRQTVHNLANPHCPTLGLCMNQDALHEQQGTAIVLNKDPSLIDRVVSIVEPRDENSALRSDISLNTFHGHDNECYLRHRKGWSDNPYVHRLTSYNKNAAWKRGDWTGQVAAIPVYGKQLPVVNGQCVDSPDVPLGEIRYKKIKEIIDQTIR